MITVSVKGKIITDNTGIERDLPVLLTEDGPLESLLDFIAEKASARSYSWMEKVLESVKLFLEYADANACCFENRTSLMKAFAERLVSGTIGEDGIDPTGLYWRPRKRTNASQLIGLLDQYFDWLVEHRRATPLNPLREATPWEQHLKWGAQYSKYNRSFLAHLHSRKHAADTVKTIRCASVPRAPISEREEVYSFPEEKIFDLLFRGFVIPGRQNSPNPADRLNIRDILITILMHGGSVRVSEPFHLYVQDVRARPDDPTCALVRIFHPEEGAPPVEERGKYSNRNDYLKRKFGIRPRTKYADGRYAGWKDPKLDSRSDGFMFIYWFPRFWGRLFLLFWNLYLPQRAQVRAPHPFAFVSFGGPKPGSFYTKGAFEKNYEAALARIGVSPLKTNGTTAHGHRHAYGRRLKRAKIPGRYIQKAMHHKSIESQLIYTEPAMSEASAILNAASAKLEDSDGVEHGIKLLDSFDFRDVDPLGLLSGPDRLLPEFESDELPDV